MFTNIERRRNNQQGVKIMSREEAKQSGQWVGLVMSVLGVAIAAVFLGLIGGLGELWEGSPLVVTGVVAIVMLCGWIGGGIAAERIYAGENPYLCGVLLAFASVTISTVVVAAPFALRGGLSKFFLVIMGVLFWVLLYGFIPMVLLGVVYGVFVRKVRAS
jgi:hypothetical protein